MKARLVPSLALVAALTLAACSSAPAATVPPGASPATRIEVTLTDSFQVQPDPLVVPVGVPVTFVVTNTGVLEHEIFFGDEEAQQEHESEMQAIGGMPHDHPNGIAVKPGETREIVQTFEAEGSSLAGCHLPGHYAAGMKAAVLIVR